MEKLKCITADKGKPKINIEILHFRNLHVPFTINADV